MHMHILLFQTYWRQFLLDSRPPSLNSLQGLLSFPFYLFEASVGTLFLATSYLASSIRPRLNDFKLLTFQPQLLKFSYHENRIRA